MRLWITDYITSTLGAPVKSGTVDLIQSAYKEIVDQMVKTAIGKEFDNTKTYRLYGAQLTSGAGDDYSTSAGAIYYQGEVYLVDATVGTVNMPDGFGLTISTTYFTGVNADPVTMDDGITIYNLHSNRKMKYYNEIGSSPIPLPAGLLSSGFTDGGASASYGTLIQPDNLIMFGSLDASTVKFDRSRAITFGTASTGNNAITLSTTGAVQGTVVNLFQNGVPGATVSFTSTATIIKNGFNAFGTDGKYAAEITYTGPLTNTFIVNGISNIGGASLQPFITVPNGSYLSGWTASSSGTVGPMKYTKSYDGQRVYIVGGAMTLSGSPGSSFITTLPVGYRPVRETFIPIWFYNTNSSTSYADKIDILPDGTIYYVPTVTIAAGSTVYFNTEFLTI